MPASPTFSGQDGHLHLDLQRKRAKALLRELRADQPGALQRLQAHAPSGLDHPPRLADCQWLIARELGFASWPKLKAHVEAIAFAARHPDFASADEPTCLHLRCGNDIAHSLTLAGFRGEFRMFADPLAMGPVPALAEAEFRALRARYVSQAFGIEAQAALHRTQDEYAVLDSLAERRRVVLWCEADAYDQLFLMRVLAGLPRLPEHLELIEIDRVPGVERFIGIGQLAPELLAWLWPQRRPLGEAALELASEAWAAYRHASPQAWANLAAMPTPALPLLGPALRRQLQELPAARDGLSLTERLSLQIVAEHGERTLGLVFAELMQLREPLPWLGDAMFHVLMRPLIDSPTPLLRESQPEQPWPRRPVSLTALGRQVLAGERHGLDQMGVERWVGGVRLRPGQPHWTLDEALRPRWRE
ncbi:MAG: hypothetical protein GAK43_02188 [Stenotrophomonas maltophilia]|nr:MAG: hypothetical protein GAK43_02188 [Stenotrophomonas maltophilia]